MKYTLPTLALLGVFLLQPASGNAAQADTASASHKPKFEDCDTNKDGFLSKEEFQVFRPRSAEHFTAIDKDGNGLVSHEELKAWRDARRAERGRRFFEECDKNKDGALSKEEFLACKPKGAEKFAKMDKDGNGMVSQEEFTAWHDSRRGEGRHRSPFEECDKNKDGLLSKEEVQACMPRLAGKFAEIDKDGNGQLSREELKAWHARRGEREAGTVKNEGAK